MSGAICGRVKVCVCMYVSGCVCLCISVWKCSFGAHRLLVAVIRQDSHSSYLLGYLWNLGFTD